MYIDIGIELMEVKHATGIVAQMLDGAGGIALTTALVKNDEPHLCPTVGWVKTYEICDTDSPSFRIINHQASLAISIDVCCGMSHIVV